MKSGRHFVLIVQQNFQARLDLALLERHLEELVPAGQSVLYLVCDLKGLFVSPPVTSNLAKGSEEPAAASRHRAIASTASRRWRGGG